MPARLLNILIVDDNPDGRFIVAKALLRKFPLAVVHECTDSDAAVDAVKEAQLSAVLVHRAHDTDGVALVAKMRAANEGIPIVFISGNAKRAEAALAAGATEFLHYDRWATIGDVVADILGMGVGANTAIERRIAV